MNTSAHVIFDFKQKNLVNFSNKMRLPYLTYFRCAFGCWILFSKAKNSQSIRRSCEFHFSFFFLSLSLVNFNRIWKKGYLILLHPYWFFTIALEHGKKIRDWMLYLKYKRHLFGCDLMLTRLDCYICEHFTWIQLNLNWIQTVFFLLSCFLVRKTNIGIFSRISFILMGHLCSKIALRHI